MRPLQAEDFFRGGFAVHTPRIFLESPRLANSWVDGRFCMYHSATMNNGPLPFLLTGLLSWTFCLGAESLPSKSLTEIATRYKMPMPPKEARLVLAHTESWSALSNPSTSRDPGIYSPAFLLEERTNGSAIVLRGTERQTLESRHGTEPLWRPFSTARVEPKLGGHVAAFDRLSAFVCAVQLAARGDESTAQDIWRRFSAEEWWSDGHPLGRASEQVKNPPLLLASCIFNHLRNRVLQPRADWQEIHARMWALFDEFPALKDELRNEVFDGLTAAINAKSPAPGSTEALLLNWSRRPTAMSHFGLFDEERESEAEAPAREIVLKGEDAVPDLIALLEDRRITAHEVPAFMNAPARIQRVGELAARLLEEITGIQGSFSGAAPDRTALRAWLETARQQGEAVALAEAVFTRKDGKITGVNETPARTMAHKFPEKLVGLCDEFSKNATPEAQPFALSEAIATARLSKEVRVKALTEFARQGSLEQKRCVLQNLAKVDDKKCAEILASLLGRLPPDSSGPYWTCPEAGFTHVVMQVESDDTWRTYLQAAKRSSIGLRMEMMNPLCYTYIGEKNRERRLAFAAAFLDDEAVRDMSSDPAKYGGPCAAFTIPKIAVRDFAALKIASILKLPERCDEFWTSIQWAELRKKVRERLALEKLPSLAGPQDR